MWKYVAGTLALSSIAYSVIRYFAGGVCSCIARLDGLVVVITGANSGIGKALAFEAANRGAIVILGCRDFHKAVDTQSEIIKLTNNENIYIKQLDLCSFKSIKKFVTEIENEFLEVYALVNNAGVFYQPQLLTEDGFDVTFQTNYLGPFILTHEILRLLKSSDHARIINVTSEAHRLVNEYDLKAVSKCQKEFRSHLTAYGVTKLALILFTREFGKKLKNTNIVINAVNPGNVETAIYRNYPSLANPWLYALQWPIRLLIVKSPKQGAQSSLHALLTSNRFTGQYISDCSLKVPSPFALNDRLATEYYNLTLELLDNQFSTESEC